MVKLTGGKPALVTGRSNSRVLFPYVAWHCINIILQQVNLKMVYQTIIQKKQFEVHRHRRYR